MGAGYAQAVMADSSYLAEPVVSFIGIWDPVAWLILFVVVLCGVTLVSLMGRSGRGAVTLSADPKHATFFGGEQAEYSHVAGADLFWGFKHNLRGYLGFMARAHSGVTNDYVIWGVCALAVITAYCFIFM